MNSQAKSLFFSAVRAIAGAIVGCLVFVWIARQGYYALMIPGGLTGIGGGLLMKDRSVPRGIICGVIGLIAGVVSEWLFAPFSKDPSLGYFLMNLPRLQPITLLMIAAGAIFGYWFAVGRPAGPGSEATVPPGTGV